ncbi:MAG: hypothetical protein QOJ06_9 [Pseudonocardiales bacterium]|jgi:hypothetical protein|nr:hypothetical protein [Pseudonocardiales bacterium]
MWFVVRFVGAMPTLVSMISLLTESDLVRGRAPDLTSPHSRCSIVVDQATGAVCTMRPPGDDVEHRGFEAVTGGGRDRRLVAWRGGDERALVSSTATPGAAAGYVEVRALGDRPLVARQAPD